MPENDDTIDDKDDDTTTGAGDGDTKDKADDGDAKQLGDAGKRALDAMKRDRAAARRELAEARAKLAEFEDKDKTDTERLSGAASAATARAEKAEVGLRKIQTAMDRAPEHATLAQIRAVAKRLSGESDEELESDADELFGLFVAPADTSTKDAGGKDDDTTTARPTVPQRPREKLRGGGDPDEEPEETDPRKLADLIGRH
jgi:hypothetical protein